MDWSRSAGQRVGRVDDALRVEGTANVKLLPRPPLSLAWGTAVSGDERVSVDSTSLLVRGAKEFDWIVTPRETGDQVVVLTRNEQTTLEQTGSWDPLGMRGTCSPG